MHLERDDLFFKQVFDIKYVMSHEELTCNVSGLSSKNLK